MDRQIALAEQVEEVGLAVAPVSLQGLHDRGGGQPLMDEQRQGRHLERQPFGLSGPVEERLRQRLQGVDFGAGRGHLPASGVEVGAGNRARIPFTEPRGEPCDALPQRGDLRLRPLSRRVPSVPVEGRRQRRVVAPGGRLLLPAELRLRTGIGPEQSARLGMPVALGPPPLVLPAHRRVPGGCLRTRRVGNGGRAG